MECQLTDDVYMSENEAEKYLGLAHSTLFHRRHRKTNFIPYYLDSTPLSRSILYKKSELDAWLVLKNKPRQLTKIDAKYHPEK